jgi:hypothetical protein
MNKEIARYFVKLIAEDLQFSFNGMGIPSYSCEWLENQLIQGNYDKVKEFIQKRYDEHENSAKDTNIPTKKTKHKFRTMTNAEFCDKWLKNHLFCKSIVSDGYCCPISPTDNCFRESFLNKPCIINGKYILIEVKE